jgi:hypothetical protein
MLNWLIAAIRRLVIIVPMMLLVTLPEGASATPAIITPEGSGNLWNQTAPGEWVWNQAGDPWPLGFSASDPSGVCMLARTVSGHEEISPSSFPYNYPGPCPSGMTWTPKDGATVDTRAFIIAAGAMQLNLMAVNPAQVPTDEAQTVQVDNDPVGVVLRTFNDPTPALWVNHAVTVNAAPTAGPSGVAGTRCQADGLGAAPYPAQGVTLDGDGVHTLSCTAWNNAVDPHGRHNQGSASIDVHIDEVPPLIRFEPRTARAPTTLVIDATDDESGVGSGSLQLAPAGSNSWVTLPTSVAGGQLTAQLDDRELNGPYALRATACDNAGNCSSATEAIALPLRTAPDFEVSLTRIVDPVRRRVVYKRVLVDWHWATIHRRGRSVRVKRGGHLDTIRVVEIAEPCTNRSVRIRPHRRRLQWRCTTPRPRLTTRLKVPYGHGVTVYGRFTTANGLPLSGQSIDISAAVDNHTDAFHEVTTATTAVDGSWTARLPPGPSRVIRAATDGTATILPASGQVRAVVPAHIKLLRVWPRHVRWSGTVHLVGQLLGGYLPPGGALVRLRIGYGSTYNTYGVQEHVAGNGRFSTVATFGPGDPRVGRIYWFQIASLPMGDYPYAPGASERVPIAVGGHLG